MMIIYHRLFCCPLLGKKGYHRLCLLLEKVGGGGGTLKENVHVLCCPIKFSVPFNLVCVKFRPLAVNFASALFIKDIFKNLIRVGGCTQFTPQGNVGPFTW